MITLAVTDQHRSGESHAEKDEPPGFAERWAAWQAKGTEHDARSDRRMAIGVAMVLALLVVSVLWLMLP
jgi:hypothetical protein